MPQRRSPAWTEVRVGLLVVASFALLAAAVFYISGETGFFTKTYTVTVYFSSANGLRKGGEVWLEGVTVGNVKGVRLSKNPTDANRSVEVDLEIFSDYQDEIRTDSTVSVGTIGLLGDKYVDILRGSAGGTPIQDKGTLQGTEAGDIKQIITGTNDFVANLADLSKQFKKMSDRIDRGEGTLGKFLTDESIFNNANEAIANVNATVKETNAMIADAHSGDGTIGRLISDRELYDGIVGLTKRMDNLVAAMERGEGTAGKFLKDPTLYNKANELLAKTEGLVNRIERGEGTLGKLSSDDALYMDMRQTMTDVRGTLNRVSSLLASVENGEGTVGKLLKDPSLFNNLNQTVSEMQKFLYDVRQDPKKYMTIILKLL